VSTDAADGGTRELDVGKVDGEPFDETTSALESLPEDGALVLVSGFEPEPLYAALERRGYAYETSRAADGEWRVTITEA
jgi:uncharacterized protein (DUF2249 family)